MRRHEIGGAVCRASAKRSANFPDEPARGVVAHPFVEVVQLRSVVHELAAAVTQPHEFTHKAGFGWCAGEDAACYCEAGLDERNTLEILEANGKDLGARRRRRVVVRFAGLRQRYAYHEVAKLFARVKRSELGVPCGQ